MAGTELIGETESVAIPFGYRRVFRFYFPLALSWLLMSMDGPIAVAVLSQLPGKTVATAAFSVVMSLALWIESPIIDLLSTSTTLATSRRNYLLLRRFTYWLLGIVTLGHLVVLEPHLFSFLSFRVWDLTSEMSHAAWLGMAVVIPWSACIGWRRYSQGILIRNGVTRPIGIGTLVRVASMAAVALSLLWLGSLPGIQIVAASMVVSVAAEAAFIHWSCRSVIRERYAETTPATEGAELTMSRLIAFHGPLTLTTLLVMASFPTITMFLSRTSDKTLTLAAWQVALSLAFLMRTPVFALPEAVIALTRNRRTAQVLARFSGIVGIVLTALMVAMALSGLDRWIFEEVYRTEPSVAEAAHLGFWASAALPLIGACQSYLRGMLTAAHQTPSRLWAMLTGYVSLVLALIFGLRSGMPGVVFAGLSLTFGLATELAVLSGFWVAHQRRNLDAASIGVEPVP